MKQSLRPGPTGWRHWPWLGWKALRILAYRLRHYPLPVNVAWFYTRFLSRITGVPLLRYSRITPQLYVGPQFDQRGLRRLQEEGITASVNLRLEFDDAAHGLALPRYCYLPTLDDHAPSLAHLQAGTAFIRQVIEDGGKVYVHCAGGIGRAPTMAAAYLVSTGLSLPAALALLQRGRPFINIMPAQMEQLHRWENHTH